MPGSDLLLIYLMSTRPNEAIRESTVVAYHGKYKSPSELLSDESLSRDEKIEMLEQWRHDKKALMRASEEGMHGEIRMELLSQIKDALRSLREKSSG